MLLNDVGHFGIFATGYFIVRRNSMQRNYLDIKENIYNVSEKNPQNYKVIFWVEVN